MSMLWTKEADELISKVPFFVRKRVRKQVEAEARTIGAASVTPDHVRSCQQKFLRNPQLGVPLPGIYSKKASDSEKF
ncbi:MAG: hypothetical protein BWK80_04000 [Desulfobacteraceae bacterium IS3]|nr:MAG: hypothetical protein BWK80_04000 [Desulfobacteraceae bacterium IS3]